VADTILITVIFTLIGCGVFVRARGLSKEVRNKTGDSRREDIDEEPVIQTLFDKEK